MLAVASGTISWVLVDETRSFARASPPVIDFAQEHRGRASA
jgi:hypothetical protein